LLAYGRLQLTGYGRKQEPGGVSAETPLGLVQEPALGCDSCDNVVDMTDECIEFDSSAEDTSASALHLPDRVRHARARSAPCAISLCRE
jgi:hypothetical protein